MSLFILFMISLTPVSSAVSQCEKIDDPVAFAACDAKEKQAQVRSYDANKCVQNKEWCRQKNRVSREAFSGDSPLEVRTEAARECHTYCFVSRANVCKDPNSNNVDPAVTRFFQENYASCTKEFSGARDLNDREAAEVKALDAGKEAARLGMEEQRVKYAVGQTNMEPGQLTDVFEYRDDQYGLSYCYGTGNTGRLNVDCRSAQGMRYSVHPVDMSEGVPEVFNLRVAGEGGPPIPATKPLENRVSLFSAAPPGVGDTLIIPGAQRIEPFAGETDSGGNAMAGGTNVAAGDGVVGGSPGGSQVGGSQVGGSQVGGSQVGGSQVGGAGDGGTSGTSGGDAVYGGNNNQLQPTAQNNPYNNGFLGGGSGGGSSSGGSFGSGSSGGFGNTSGSGGGSETVRSQDGGGSYTEGSGGGRSGKVASLLGNGVARDVANTLDRGEMDPSLPLATPQTSGALSGGAAVTGGRGGVGVAASGRGGVAGKTAKTGKGYRTAAFQGDRFYNRSGAAGPARGGVTRPAALKKTKPQRKGLRRNSNTEVESLLAGMPKYKRSRSRQLRDIAYARGGNSAHSQRRRYGSEVGWGVKPVFSGAISVYDSFELDEDGLLRVDD